MPITSARMPTLMNMLATQGVKISMAASQDANQKAFFREFMRDGGAINGLSVVEQDYEPGAAMAPWPEMTSLPELDFNEGYALKLTTNHFGGAFKLSVITVEAGKKELVAKGPKLLAEAEARTREILGHALLLKGDTALASIPNINGVSIANPICGDGLPLFSASHTWRSSGSTILNTNILSSYSHPTQTGVFQVNKLVKRWRQPNNEPMIGVKVRKLLVPGELELMTDIFAKSAKNPLDATGAANLYSQMVPEGVVVDPWLPSTSDWYALTTRADQLPQIREFRAPTSITLPFNPETLCSGVVMWSSYAMGSSVAGWTSIVQVTGTPGVVSNSML